ncbi:cytochrome b5 [Aspergillus caelatus]|uniref:Cytochrome b5 n=1 Tax=Aspergillus caelatus TaxID=61420 RepID=A0A5N7AC97_9EURO|nr:cytochrome b5 [Aspergillus caelatus]KAE8367484.1 cytochrome b5 [Aspergillus caelatus]
MSEHVDNLDPPKCDHISLEDLAQSDGSDSNRPTLFAIKGVVFDVSTNPAFAPEGCYHVYAGKDPSRALALSSCNPADCRPEYDDLGDLEQTILNEWFDVYSKRYNIVGRCQKDSHEEDSDGSDDAAPF